MQNTDLILTLAAGLIGALAFGYAAHRLGLSPIVGYLLAGVLVGPHTPGFVADKHLSEQLAEVGVILLMFGVGLHFHLKDLLAVRKVALVGTLCQSVVAAVLGALAAQALAWDPAAGAVFAIALSVASTAVTTRVLSDNGQLHSATGRIAIGWLVVEDVFSVLVLVLLPLAYAREAAGNMQAALLVALKVAVFVPFLLLAGGRAIPWMLRKIAQTGSRELFTLSVLAIALGIAFGSARLFGASMALGAFLAGMVVGQSDFSARAGAEALPLRDAFAVMFFLSIGMLLDPGQALREPLLPLATLAAVLILRPLVTLLVVVALGHGSRTGLGVALARGQVGEFSFLLAAVGRQIGLLPESAMNALVTTAVASIALNPMIYPFVGRIEATIKRRPRLWRLLNRDNQAPVAETPSDNWKHRAIVVGHGPIGRSVARLLKERGIEPVIVEMNIDTHMRLRAAGLRAVHGDANQREVLERAGIETAASLIVSTSGSAGAIEAIRIARQLNPKIHIVSRVDYLSQAGALLKSGADEVFSGEGEVALAITDSILRELGATPDQLDEERARIRTELFNQPG